ncbi:MAG: PorT family protein [Treponema sp.]|jgi:hypothetical protein|nr:PorT family protein [Treponema sp.]
MKKCVLAFAAALLLFGITPFSPAQTPEERIETGRFGAEEPDAGDNSGGRTYKNHWLFLGGRLGSSLPSVYTPEGDTAFTGGDAYGLSLDAGFQAGVQISPRLSLQAEINLVLDSASMWLYALNAGKNDVDSYTRQFTGLSLQFPFMAKLHFYPANFRVSPFLGLSLLAPLGKITVNDVFAGKNSFAWSYAPPPLGILGGLNVSFFAGPGIFFADLRVTADLGKPALQDAGGIDTYRRYKLIISAGYEFGFFKKQQTGRAK